MPGLCGFAEAGSADEARDGARAPETLRDLLEGLRHHPDHQAVAPRAAETNAAWSRVACGLVLRAPDAAGGFWESPQGLRVWLDGEAFGPDAPLSVAEIAERLTRGEKPEILNGAFAAVIHDPARRRLRFLTDPYGLKFLYLRAGPRPAWCGELQGFLALPGAPPAIDAECARQILEHGHPLGGTTWFEGVELLGPAADLSFDLDTGAWTRETYFDLEGGAREAEAGESKTRSTRPRAGFGATAVELARLFRAAVARRSPASERIGITLSGGLDSRALLAALPPENPVPQTLTFGRPGCADAVLAARAAAVRGAPHAVMTLGGGSWLEERAEFVLRTDGQVSILDLHGLESIGEVERRMDVCLHGFLGDALLGGSYLDRANFSFVDQYRHRGRRFILQTLHFAGTRVRYRYPFLDLALNARVLALPRGWLKNSRVYRAMLLRAFPAYFRSIPWEKTGLPISASPLRVLAFRARRKARVLWARLRGRAPDSGPAYADYPNWLREKPSASYLKRMLGAGAEAHAFAPEDETARLLERHFAGGDASEKIGRLLTLEIWLRFARGAGARFPTDSSTPGNPHEH